MKAKGRAIVSSTETLEEQLITIDARQKILESCKASLLKLQADKISVPRAAVHGASSEPLEPGADDAALESEIKRITAELKELAAHKAELLVQAAEQGHGGAQNALRVLHRLGASAEATPSTSSASAFGPTATGAATAATTVQDAAPSKVLVFNTQQSVMLAGAGTTETKDQQSVAERKI